jgi:predicted HicB family RNase H-like nuclease
MGRPKAKESEKRKKVMIAMRPDIHDRLRKIALKQNLSMSRIIENLILQAKL